MSHSHRRHDVYDDTDRGQAGREAERHPVPVIRRRHNQSGAHNDRRMRRTYDGHQGHQSYHSHYGTVVDPFHGIDATMRRFEEDFGVGVIDGTWGFGSMFGGRGMMSSFDRMFEDATAGLANAAQNGGGAYFYESKTRTVGPDGRVHEEHVRTTPDEHGNPRTTRTVRDGDNVREMSPFYSSRRDHRGGTNARPGDVHREPEVIVEEVDDGDEAAHTVHNSRRRARHHQGDVEVEEVLEPAEQSTRAWMRERYRQWRSHN